MAKKKSARRDSIKKDKKVLTPKLNVSAFRIVVTFFSILVVMAFFYLLTVVIVGREEKAKDTEVSIQYEEILAGSSFSMRPSEYLVVYYDKNDSQNSEITPVVSSYSNGAIYSVDMSDAFNKKYIALAKSNKKPKKSSDLAINGPTLIKIKDGKAVEYIEGVDQILAYIK